MLVLIAFWGLMGLAFFIRVLNPPAPTVPQPGSAIYFRGNNIALLRMVSRPPYEAIELADDGTVARYTYPITTGSSSTHSVLSPTELAAIQQLRLQWCHQPPTFRPLGPTEPFYDLGFECGGYTTKQAKVPIDMLPSAFEAIVREVPRPVPK